MVGSLLSTFLSLIRPGHVRAATYLSGIQKQGTFVKPLLEKTSWVDALNWQTAFDMRGLNFMESENSGVQILNTSVQTKTLAEVRQGLAKGERLEVMDCPHCKEPIGIVIASMPSTSSDTQ